MTALLTAEPQLFVRDIAIRDGARLNFRQLDEPAVDPARRDEEGLFRRPLSSTTRSRSVPNFNVSASSSRRR